MFRHAISVLVIFLAVSIGWRSASAASFHTVHTHSGFGLLFVLASDGHGNLYVADQKHYAILKLSSSGTLMLKDPMPKNCGISGLGVSPAGDVYAVANCQSLVYHFSPAGRLLRRFGRQPPGPAGVAVDSKGHVYLTYGYPPGLPPPAPPGVKVKTFSNRFVEFTADGTPLRTVNLAGVHDPWGIAVDGNGNAYVTTTDGLVKVSPAGHFLRRWNRIVPARAKYIIPSQPAVDRQGNVYAIDGADTVVKISTAGHVLGAIVGRGSAPGAVQQPVGLAVTNGSHLFVGEVGPNRIKEFSLSGALIAVWTP